MKKSILSALFLLTIASLSFAQQALNKLSIGIVAGPTHTYFRGEEQRNDNESDYRKAAGISIKYQPSRLFLKVDFLYEDKGFVTDYMLMDNSGRLRGVIPFKYHFHYITVPILAGVTFKKLGLFLNAGPYLSFLQKQNAVYEYDEYDYTDNWEKTDYGLTSGIGYSRTLFSHFQISAEIRYNIGMKDVDLRELDYKTNSTALLLGLHYTLGGN
ncbi:porin family protein [Rufibacter glacialis]|uniref:PorT family protein n=1 Tax=Rufibacter glacialis TaxID=1259555 RepID=A0A5M8QKL3_9BACT|nr:porin family protein [Rufibacter glacialis]KAA6435306.1 PorT family protein [Rufibacter glacialis]GGK62198.1 hypothetical protein GCM10011405_07890 [Rufibacter glacialis]